MNSASKDAAHLNVQLIEMLDSLQLDRLVKKKITKWMMVSRVTCRGEKPAPWTERQQLMTDPTTGTKLALRILALDCISDGPLT